MSKVPVSIATDLTAGPTIHVVYLPNDDWDAFAPMDWSPGHYMNKHSIARRIFHKGQGIVLDGHDLGPLLPHGPFCNPVHMVKSSRKVIATASTVVGHGKAFACTELGRHRMMVCGDPVAEPHGANYSNPAHTVFVGMTAQDELKHQLAVVASVATDLICFAVAGPIKDLSSLIGDLTGYDPLKMGVGAASSLVTSVGASYASGWKEPISIKVEGGNGFLSNSGELSYNPETKECEAKQMENKAGMKVERQLNKDGYKETRSDWGGEERTKTGSDAVSESAWEKL